MEQQICPSCGAKLRHTSEIEWACDHCGNLFSHGEGAYCPACKVLNPADARFCSRCGAHLIRRCPSCNHENPLSAEYCANCGVALDIVTVLMMRLEDREGESASRRAEEAAAVKEADQRYSEEIRRDLERREQERLAELAALRAESQRQQRIISNVMIVAGVIVIIIVVVAVVLSLR